MLRLKNITNYVLIDVFTYFNSFCFYNKGFKNYSEIRESIERLEGRSLIYVMENAEGLDAEYGYKVNVKLRNDKLLMAFERGEYNYDFCKHKLELARQFLQLLQEKNLRCEVINDNIISIQVEEFISNNFFKNAPFSHVYKFVSELKQIPEKREVFSKKAFDILSNVEAYLIECDEVEEIQNFRQEAGKPYRKLKALDFKKEKTIGVVEDRYKVTNILQELDHDETCKMVPIDGSPFWIGVNVVTGESALEIDRRLMHYPKLSKQYINDVYNAISQTKYFQNISEERNTESEEYFYLFSDYLSVEAKFLYFCQAALVEMKEMRLQEEKIQKAKEKAGTGMQPESVSLKRFACESAEEVEQKRKKV